MDRTTQVIQVIEKNPGIQFSEIMRETGMKNGVLSHYTRKLEESGTVQVERTPRVTRFYPLGINKEESALVKNLRQETPKNILIALLEQDSLTFNEVAEKIKRSPATVSVNLTQLIQDDIVDSKFVNTKRIFMIRNKNLVQSAINKYHPDMMDKSADRIGDIFSSL
ncbi:MAG: winged helix-turn-helix transcriptional regulator [Candidatus Nitrosotenuis sp.]|nr:MAG: winged helix-turn-helix transcriptional regulator [Candidatus Nitrosotenuis sp.]